MTPESEAEVLESLEAVSNLLNILNKSSNVLD